MSNTIDTTDTTDTTAKPTTVQISGARSGVLVILTCVFIVAVTAISSLVNLLLVASELEEAEATILDLRYELGQTQEEYDTVLTEQHAYLTELQATIAKDGTPCVKENNILTH